MKKWICVAGLAVALAPGVALADGPQAATGSADELTAQVLSDQAYEAYEKGNFAKAIEAYLGSYKLVPTADILYNVANIYDKKLNEPKLAVEFYRRYNAAPDAKPDLVGKATARVATLSAPGGGAPGNGQGSGAGGETGGGGSTTSVDNGKTLRIVGLVTGGLGIVGLGVGAVTGLVAKGQHSDSGCSNGACASPSAVQSEKSAASTATISTVSFIAGGVLLGTGVILYLVAPKTAERVGAVRFLPHTNSRSSGFDFVARF